MKYLNLIALLLFVSACTTPIEAQFEGSTSELLEKLNSTSEFEDSNITWNASSFNGETIHNLTLELYNGKYLPKSDSALRENGKDALKVVLGSLRNKNDYNVFSVVYISQESTGIETTTYSRGFDFSLNELEE